MCLFLSCTSVKAGSISSARTLSFITKLVFLFKIFINMLFCSFSRAMLLLLFNEFLVDITGLFGTANILFIAFCTLSVPSSIPIEIVPPKFNLSKSLNGPSLAGENGRKSLTFPTKFLAASFTFPAAALIPSAIISGIFLPALMNLPNIPVTASYAPVIPFLTAFLTLLIAPLTIPDKELNIFEIVDLIELTTLDTVDLILFHIEETVELILFITDDITDFIAFHTDETTDLILFTTDETTDFIVFHIEETVELMLFITDEITDLMPFQTDETTDLITFKTVEMIDCIVFQTVEMMDLIILETVFMMFTIKLKSPETTDLTTFNTV